MADILLLASRLKNRIAFLRLVKNRQPNGSFLEEWVEHKKTWAEVVTIGGEEGRLAAAQSSEVRYRVRVRHRTDIDESMRIQVGRERILGIAAIRDPDGTRVMLEINAVWKQGGA